MLLFVLPACLLAPGGTDNATARSEDSAAELCNHHDDDGDGFVDEAALDEVSWYPDRDGDGFGDPAAVTWSCWPIPTLILASGDCDDTNGAVFPGSAETCNDTDDDCDGVVDEDTALGAPIWFADADADGFGDPAVPFASCGQPAQTVVEATDCDDTNPAVHPGASEACNDGTDNDCDGSTNSCRPEGALDLAATIAGGASGLGYSVAISPDLTGDGIPDCVAGARAFQELGVAVGAAYVFAGPFDHDRATGEAAGILVGDRDAGGAGSAIVALGDTDGNGIGELLVGAPERDGGAGAVFLYGETVGGVARLADGRLLLEGATAHARLGFSLSRGGDFLGTGAEDLLVGAYGAGEAWAIPGSATGEAFPGEIGLRMWSDGCAGWSVAGLGDGDGDGFDDALVGDVCDSTQAALGGAIAIVRGPLSTDVATSDADGLITGATDGLYLGATVASAGDADGDGLSDVLVGSAGGQAWLVPGNHVGSSGIEVALATFGDEGDEESNPTAIAALDFDGDDRADVAIGCSLRSEDAEEGGSVHIYYGALSGSYYDGNAYADGTYAFEHLGRALSGGDATGDGVADLLVGTDIEAIHLLKGRGW